MDVFYIQYMCLICIPCCSHPAIKLLMTGTIVFSKPAAAAKSARSYTEPFTAAPSSQTALQGSEWPLSQVTYLYQHGPDAFRSLFNFQLPVLGDTIMPLFLCVLLACDSALRGGVFSAHCAADIYS